MELGWGRVQIKNFICVNNLGKINLWGILRGILKSSYRFFINQLRGLGQVERLLLSPGVLMDA